MTTCSVALFAATDLALRRFSSRSRRCCSADDGNRLLARKKKQQQQRVTHFLARNREERRRELEPSAKEEIQRRESDGLELGQNFVRGRSNDRERDGGEAARAAFTCALAASLLCFGTLDFLPELAGEELKRRELLLGVTEFRIHVPHMTMLLNALSINQHAHAAGLFQMPPVRLNNRYYLVRAGESKFETKGIINTNPVTKTSIDNGLSELGKRQTAKAASKLKDLGACDGSCWIWPSITQRAYQTAEIIAYANNIGRSRIVPEYSFLDARGLGAYEGKQLADIKEVYTTDAVSPNLRPPPYTDGTPNESVADVFVRVTQLMSILETQYFGDTIVIVSPDSDNLSVLQAGLIGLDLRRHIELAFAPGEVRLVDPLSIPIPRPAVSGLIKCTGKLPQC